MSIHVLYYVSNGGGGVLVSVITKLRVVNRGKKHCIL